MRSASTAGALLCWAPAVLGLFCAEDVSTRLSPSHGTIDVMRVYVPRFFVSSQQRFGVKDIKAPRRVTALRSWIDRVIALRSQMDHVITLRQIRVTAQCYSSILFRRYQENPSSRREGMSIQRHEEKSTPACGRERASFGSSFYVFLSLGLSYVNWASQECCLFYLRSSLRSWDLLLFSFHGLFPSLSFSHCHFGLLFPVLPT